MTDKKLSVSNDIRKTLLYCMEVMVLTGVGQVLGMLITDVLISGVLRLSGSPLYSDPAYRTFSEYFGFIGIWIVFFVYYSRRKNEIGILDVLGKKCRGNTVVCFIVGILIGFSTNFICGYLAMKNGDFTIGYIGFRPLASLAVFVAVLIQSGAEELLCRGLLYHKLSRRFGDGLKPIIISSLLFACLHLFNEGITVISLLNLFLAGIVPALMIYYFDSLWMCIAEHTAWNYTQNILLGLPNSGIRVPFSIFGMTGDTVRDSFFYNVGFGIEGSAICVVVLTVLILAMFLLMNRRRKPGYDVWQGISEAEIERIDQEKEDERVLKQIGKSTEKDYSRNLKKDPDYTYAQLLDFELKKEEKAKKGLFPRMIVVILVTLVLFVFIIPESDARTVTSVIFGELLGIAFALPYSNKLSRRRVTLLKEYLGEKIKEESNENATAEYL